MFIMKFRLTVRKMLYTNKAMLHTSTSQESQASQKKIEKVQLFLSCSLNNKY